MEFVKKNLQQIVGVGLGFLYLFSRFYNILKLPIFTDEAIYIRWAQIAQNDPAQFFISLTDGKQPLFIWLMLPFITTVSDPLFAGRLVSVLAGLVSMGGLYFLTKELFNNKKIAVITCLIYILFPFSLVYDRMALYDSLVATFTIWALYLEIILVKRSSIKSALALSLVVGGGLLTKSTAYFFLLLLPVSLLLFNFKEKQSKKKLTRWILLGGAITVISILIYSTLRFSPYFYLINQKNDVFIYPLKVWIKDPFSHIVGNLRGLVGWLFGYMTIPFIVLVLSSFLFGKFLKEKLLLMSWFIIPFFALAFFGKIIYPRYILFMTMPLLVLGGYTLHGMTQRIKKNSTRIIIFVVFLSTFLINDYFIITDFSKAAIPQTDKAQFISEWPSGVGVKETVDFLKKQVKHGKIYVGTEGTFGLMPFALEIYLHDNKNIILKSFFWELTNTPPKEVLAASMKMPTYFVFYEPGPSVVVTGEAPPTWPVKKIFQISRLEKGSYYTLYQIIPQQQ